MDGGEVLASPSLMEVLWCVPETLRREGQVYPLHSLLGMLILASVNGQSSLRGMLIWAGARWSMLVRELGFKPTRKAPVYGGSGRCSMPWTIQRWSGSCGGGVPGWEARIGV